MQGMENAYVGNGVSVSEASTTVGTEVIKAVAKKYQANNQIGKATIEIDGFGEIDNVTGDATVSVYTTDFVVEGTIYKNGGIITWGEIVPNAPSIKITNAPQTLEIGKFTTLTSQIKRVSKTPTITWTSSDDETAIISNLGVLTGVAEGNVTITAKITVDGTSYQTTCDIEIVTPPPVPKQDDYIDLTPVNSNWVGTSDSRDDWKILYIGSGETGDGVDAIEQYIYCILSDYLPNTNSAIEASGLQRVTTEGYVYSVTSTSAPELVASLNSNNDTVKNAWRLLVNDTIKSITGVEVWGALPGTFESSTPPLEYNKVIAQRGNYYYPHLNGEQHCFGYWLANNVNNFNMFYLKCNGGINTDYQCTTEWAGVCPVVKLPISEVNLTKSGKIGDTDVWSVSAKTTP